jgi:hypothetical protein
MTTHQDPGIYLIVEFNWPESITKEIGQGAKNLHDVVEKSDWISESVAASGGIGAGPSSIWVFNLKNYSALDRLLKDREDPVSQAYYTFFSNMVDVTDSVREAVLWL